ncbi:RNAPII degradation factor [Sporothrix bragantina]|uniref:RNA polymerase II degradation factor 1 n=1 Tax=Sporothrix bragantina TaxID=671064 RepID=A0ABP0BY66_9PEZI
MSSEVQSRPAAARGGRGATRGGRGGFAGRGSTRRANGDAKNDDSLASLEDEGEIGQLKKLYGAKTTLIREMFPDWSEVDILFALRETDGDENLTVTRIAEGTISQWDEVSKPKKAAKPKTSAPAAAESARPARREGAGLDKTRGRVNARATERGGRSARGRTVPPAAANGTRTEAPLSVPTEESQAWEGQKTADEEPAAVAAPTTSTSTIAPSSAPAAAAPKTWASMLRQTVVPAPKPISKPKEAAPPAQKAPEAADSLPPPSSAPAPPTEDPEATPIANAAEPAPAAADAAVAPATKEAAAPDVAVPATVVVPEVAIAPSTDALTESNLEQVDDDSHPPETDTIRSETADSWDPRSAAPPGISTPISASHQQHAAKALGSGYAATASKATGADRTAVRTPSYSRRILDQEEAVRMPVNRDVDRAAVQFGALNFNGDEDIDGDREEPETRTQPPDDSPVAHPRASLPPVAPPASVPDAFGAQKQATPAAAAASTATPTASSTLPSAPAASAPVAPPTGPAAQTAAQNTQQYGRYGQDSSAFGQKPFDAYGQPNQAQPSSNSQYDNYQGIPTSSQAQQAPAAYSSAPGEYSQYFTSDAQSRMPQYNNYYQAYGQQAAQGHQDGAQSQRPYGGYDSLSQYPQSGGASRFGAGAAAASNAAADAQNSGSTTPNPPVAGQPQSQQQQQGGAQGQHGQQQHQASQYQNYNHPYYTNPYYSQYMNQYNAFGAQNSYNAPYGGKGGYGNSHHPYMNPQNQYDHNASQASGGFGGASSLHRGAGGAESSGLGSAGLSDYGRVGAAGQAAPGFGGDNSYGRGGASSYQSQAGQGYGAQQSQVGSQQSGADDLKPYGDASKGAAGANSSLARPGSATNTQPAQSSGLPPPQSSQQGGVGGYGGYPSHLQQHGAGGLHGNNQSVAGAGGYGNQNHGNNPYGSYGQHGQGFGNNYYGNQQQRGGWGGNYH